jgi:hypothetical protein
VEASIQEKGDSANIKKEGRIAKPEIESRRSHGLAAGRGEHTAVLVRGAGRRHSAGVKWIGRIFLAIVLLLVLLCVVAFLLPARTEHTRSAELHQTPEAIFAVLSDVEKMPQWNRNIKAVDILPSIDGREATRQTFRDGMSVTIITSENLAPTHLVRETWDSAAPFSGSWSYDIAPTSDGSKVTIREKSEIRNPFFRLMVLMFGPAKYLNENLTDLGQHFGEKVKVR